MLTQASTAVRVDMNERTSSSPLFTRCPAGRVGATTAIRDAVSLARQVLATPDALPLVTYRYQREMLRRAQEATARSLQPLLWQRRMSRGLPRLFATRLALPVVRAFIARPCGGSGQARPRSGKVSGTNCLETLSETINTLANMPFPEIPPLCSPRSRPISFSPGNRHTVEWHTDSYVATQGRRDAYEQQCGARP